jgi:hypothetical protein
MTRILVNNFKILTLLLLVLQEVQKAQENFFLGLIGIIYDFDSK